MSYFGSVSRVNAWFLILILHFIYNLIIHYMYKKKQDLNRRKRRNGRNGGRLQYRLIPLNHLVRSEKGRTSLQREKNNEERGDHYPASHREDTILSPMLEETFNALNLLENPSLTSWV